MKGARIEIEGFTYRHRKVHVYFPIHLRHNTKSHQTHLPNFNTPSTFDKDHKRYDTVYTV